MALALGICFEVGATMVGTAGKQLVSHAARVEKKGLARVMKVAGLFITTLIGPILDSAAYAFAPQSIIAPLNGLDIVWNTMSAPFTLGERLTSRHVFGAILTFGGALLTSLLGPHHEQEESVEWLRYIFISRRFLTYIIVFASLLAMSTAVLLHRPKGVGDKLRGMALGMTAGGIAGNMYFISAGLGLLRSSADTGNWEAWTHWLPYPILISGALVAVSNIPFMTKGLQEYEALYMVTLFEGSHITVACVSGAWVLREMDGQTVLRQVLYWFCVLLIVAGLLVIQGASLSRLRRMLRGSTEEALSFANWQPSLPKCCARPGPPSNASENSSAEEDNHEPTPAEAQESARGPAPQRLVRTSTGSVVWAGGLSGIGSIHFGNAEDSEDAEDSDASEDSIVDMDLDGVLAEEGVAAHTVGKSIQVTTPFENV